MVTTVPPAVLPEVGEMLVIEGAGGRGDLKVNPLWMAFLPSGLMTSTVTVPAVLGRVVARSWVALTKLTLAAADEPKLTRAPD
jgi:hypothetical protein